MKKVTLCIPVHNAASTLRETLNSLIGQTYPLWKIKVLNNASTDNTLKIVQDYIRDYPFIELYSSAELVSAEDNFTKCIESAEGDFTGIVHSDDIYEPTFVENAVAIFTTHEECVAVLTHANEIDRQGKIIRERPLPRFVAKETQSFFSFKQLLLHVLKYSNFLTCPSALVRTSIYKNKIKYWNGKDFKTSADLDTWLRIAKEGSVCLCSIPLVRYRVAETSFSFRLAKTRLEEHDIFRVLDFYCHENEEWIPERSKQDLVFLRCKDTAFRVINAFKNKISITDLELRSFDWKIIFPRAFNSFWHFKITLGILAAQFLILFPSLLKKKRR